MTDSTTIVVGAGVGGLAAAVELAAAGKRVTLLERADEPGGKMRQLSVGGVGIDAGPTVFTMRWIFDGLFDLAETSLEDKLTFEAADTLARHAWRDGGELDLFASTERSETAIEAFAGSDNAAGYRAFCARSEDIYQTLREPYIASQRPGMLELVRRVGFTRLDALWRTAPFQSLWSSLGAYFSDVRLQQLFGRYATYVGSSPLQAPATLMLIAHVEQDGVWLVEGGMRAVAHALVDLGRQLGVEYRLSTGVREIAITGNRVSGIVTDEGETLKADSVVFNGDISSLGNGSLGPAARAAVTAVPPKRRALSAITFCIRARVSGFSLHYHNVFFAGDYPEEFAAIFGRGEITEFPTVYVCAQDRMRGRIPDGPERLLLLINAPADGDFHRREAAELEQWRRAALDMLAACGCELQFAHDDVVTTDPCAWHERFPGSGGSLYGRANHGSMASFARPGARSKIRGLYLAGGSVHPGAGVPMSAMSGRLAAAALLADRS